MPKGKKTKTAIYHPPKAGMPYLVVTVSPEGVSAPRSSLRKRPECWHQRRQWRWTSKNRA